MAKPIDLTPLAEQAVETLRSNKPVLQQEYGVIRIGVFGRVPKNELLDNQDLNILVEMNSNQFDLWRRLKQYIESEIGSNVHLITKGSASSAGLDITNKKVRAHVVFA